MTRYQPTKAFQDALVRCGDISLEDAKAVEKLYFDLNLVTFNVHDGTRVKHGGYLDKIVIKRALRKINGNVFIAG